MPGRRPSVSLRPTPLAPTVGRIDQEVNPYVSAVFPPAFGSGDETMMRAIRHETRLPDELAPWRAGAARVFLRRETTHDHFSVSDDSGSSALDMAVFEFHDARMVDLASTQRRMAAVGVVLVAFVGGFVVPGGVSSADSSTTSSSSSTTSTVTPGSSTTVVAPPTTTTTVRKPHPAPVLRLGSSGPSVLVLQRRLSSLGYWLGQPNGIFGDSTQQAVYALQKAASIRRDGAVGPVTAAAIARGVRARPRSRSGNVVEVDLGDDLLMIVKGGKLVSAIAQASGSNANT